MASQVDAFLREVPHVQVIEVPETDEFMQRLKLFRTSTASLGTKGMMIPGLYFTRPERLVI